MQAAQKKHKSKINLEDDRVSFNLCIIKGKSAHSGPVLDEGLTKKINTFLNLNVPAANYAVNDENHILGASSLNTISASVVAFEVIAGFIPGCQLKGDFLLFIQFLNLITKTSNYDNYLIRQQKKALTKAYTRLNNLIKKYFPTFVKG